MKDILSKFKRLSSNLLGGVDIALDIGTSNIRIGIHKKGVVLRESSYVGLNLRTDEYLFYGHEAKEIYGKAPNFIDVKKPIRNSTISDFDACVVLLDHFLKKSVYPFFLNKKLVKVRLAGWTCVPTSATEVQQKAMKESLIKAGLTNVSIIEKPIATAMGAGLPVFSNRPSFVIDMGGGIVEMAVLISGGLVASKTFKNAGEHMDSLIQNYIHLKYGVVIGEQTAERLKINLYDLNDKSDVLPIRGKSLETGLPKSVRVKSSDIREALSANLNQMIDTAKELIESIPPEIIDGIIRNGIMLTGGLAQIGGIDKYMTMELKIPVMIPENPHDTTITGLLKMLHSKKRLNRAVIG